MTSQTCNKWALGIKIFAAALSLYFLTNHFSHIMLSKREFLLPLTKLDLWIPFWPNSIWVYLAFFPFIPISYAALQNSNHSFQFLYSFLSLVVTSCIFFLIFPTRYPRELYPDQVGSLLHILRSLDYSSTCSPSLHVSISVLITFAFYRDNKSLFPFVLICSITFIISTLTLKQHYVIDVILGIFFGLIFFKLFFQTKYTKCLSPVSKE